MEIATLHRLGMRQYSTNPVLTKVADAEIDGELTNSGTLSVGDSGTLTAYGIDNSGMFNIAPEGTVNISSSEVFNAGGGNMLVDGSLFAPVELSGGLLEGNGAIHGDLNEDWGTVKPGDSPGALTVDGNYYIGSASTLEIDFQNTTGGPGTGWGFLDITGNAELLGILKLLFLNPLTFTPGEEFEVMSYGSALDENLTLNAPTLPGEHFTLVYGANQLDLSVDPNSGTATPEPGACGLLACGAAAALAAIRRLRLAPR